eukprot:gene5375-biopygen8751
MPAGAQYFPWSARASARSLAATPTRTRELLHTTGGSSCRPGNPARSCAGTCESKGGGRDAGCPTRVDARAKGPAPSTPASCGTDPYRMIGNRRRTANGCRHRPPMPRAPRLGPLLPCPGSLHGDSEGDCSGDGIAGGAVSGVLCAGRRAPPPRLHTLGSSIMVAGRGRGVSHAPPARRARLSCGSVTTPSPAAGGAPAGRRRPPAAACSDEVKNVVKQSQSKSQNNQKMIGTKTNCLVLSTMHSAAVLAGDGYADPSVARKSPRTLLMCRTLLIDTAARSRAGGLGAGPGRDPSGSLGRQEVAQNVGLMKLRCRAPLIDTAALARAGGPGAGPGRDPGGSLGRQEVAQIVRVINSKQSKTDRGLGSEHAGPRPLLAGGGVGEAEHVARDHDAVRQRAEQAVEAVAEPRRDDELAQRPPAPQQSVPSHLLRYCDTARLPDTATPHSTAILRRRTITRYCDTALLPDTATPHYYPILRHCTLRYCDTATPHYHPCASYSCRGKAAMGSSPPAERISLSPAQSAAKRPVAAKWRHLCHWRHGGKVAAKLGGKVSHGGKASGKVAAKLTAKWRLGGKAAKLAAKRQSWRQSGGKSAVSFLPDTVGPSNSDQFSQSVVSCQHSGAVQAAQWWHSCGTVEAKQVAKWRQSWRQSWQQSDGKVAAKLAAKRQSGGKASWRQSGGKENLARRMDEPAYVLRKLRAHVGVQPLLAPLRAQELENRRVGRHRAGAVAP